MSDESNKDDKSVVPIDPPGESNENIGDSTAKRVSDPPQNGKSLIQ